MEVLQTCIRVVRRSAWLRLLVLDGAWFSVVFGRCCSRLLRSHIVSRMPWVDNRNIESLEGARIARRDCGTARLRYAGDQGIAQVDDTADALAIRSQLAGGRRGHLVESEHAIREVFRKHPVECALQSAWRRPLGNSARPNRASNTVMLVSHTESAGWRSNHSTTTASGFVRINADSTLV